MDGEGEGRLLASVTKKGEREQVRLVRQRYGKYDCLDLRVWALPGAGGGEAQPTRKGITLQVAHWQRFLSALSGAVASCAGGGSDA